MALDQTNSNVGDDNVNFAILAKLQDEETHFNETDNTRNPVPGLLDPNYKNDPYHSDEGMPEVFNNNTIDTTQTVHHEQVSNPASGIKHPEGDAASIPYSGTVVLVDSFPMHLNVDVLRQKLQAIGFDAWVKEYPNQQGVDQCTYIAICSLLLLYKPDWYEQLSKPSLFNTPEKVVQLFNIMIDQEPYTKAIRLSEQHILKIIQVIKFFDANFYLPQMDIDIDTAISFFQKVRELEKSFADASMEAPDVQHAYSIRSTIASLKALLQYCLGQAKDGNFKTLLQGIMNLMESKRKVDYAEASRIFKHAVDSFEIGNWFAGVFTFGDFLSHIQEEIYATDRDSVVSKCAIVNTTEIPGEHWFAVGYEIRRGMVTFKATFSYPLI